MAGMTAWIVVMRTCIIDDYIRFAISDGVDVILNLGAGLDTRPYRMDLPGSLVWIEADYPQVIDFKQTRLAAETPKCRLERVKVDLADPAGRRDLLAGANARAQKLLVLTEGVLPYLSNEEVASLARELRTLNHARYWIVDYLSPESRKFRKRHGMARKLQNAPFKFMPADWFGFFGDLGWRAKETRYMAREAERLHRPIPLPFLFKAMIKLRWLLSSRKRREDMEKFSAYVLLEPHSSA